MPGAPPTLDHVVVLVSHETLAGLAPRLQHLFVVVPGGTHADGLTANQLILLDDGVYIEFIAFLDGADAEQRARHRWGRQPENTIVDWSYTLPHEGGFGAVQQRVADARAGYTYDDPVAGGRTRPDGVVARWAVAVAQADDGSPARPGQLPFWCLDRTPRALRVPYESQAAQTRHPCGARGVSSLAVAVGWQQLSALGKAHDAVHNAPSTASVYGSERYWRFGVPSESTLGRHDMVLVGTDGTTGIRLALHGQSGGGVQLELLPGLLVALDAA